MTDLLHSWRGKNASKVGVAARRSPAVLETAERYTLEREERECLGYAGVRKFTLDVAACAAAHLAPAYFTIHDNGLERDWSGDVWCNPPYGEANLLRWVEKCWAEASNPRVRTITMLAPCSTDQEWWQGGVEPFRDGRWSKLTILDDPRASAMAPRLETHFLAGRRQFGNPSDPRGKLVKGQPYFWLVCLVWRS